MAKGINSLSYLKLVRRKILLHCCHLQCPLLPPWRLVLLCLLLCASVRAVTLICLHRPAKGCVWVCGCVCVWEKRACWLQDWEPKPQAKSRLNENDQSSVPHQQSRQGFSPPSQWEVGLSLGIPTKKPLTEADLLQTASACPAARAEYR